MRTFLDAKAMAKSLREGLGQKQIEDDPPALLLVPQQQSRRQLGGRPVDHEGPLPGGRGQPQHFGANQGLARLTQEFEHVVEGQASMPARGANRRQQPLVAPAFELRLAGADGEGNLTGGKQPLHRHPE